MGPAPFGLMARFPMDEDAHHRPEKENAANHSQFLYGPRGGCQQNLRSQEKGETKASPWQDKLIPSLWGAEIPAEGRESRGK